MMSTNVVFMSVVYGLNNVLETLILQAYGLRQFDMCSVYLYRSRVVLFGYHLLASIVLIDIGKILKVLGQDQAAADFAKNFMAVYLRGVLIIGLNDG